MAQLLSGKVAAAAWKEKIKQDVAERLASGKSRPHLAAILVGDDPASRAYVRGKVKDCEEVGFESTLIHLPATALNLPNIFIKMRGVNYCIFGQEDFCFVADFIFGEAN